MDKHKGDCQTSSPSTGKRQEPPGGGRGPPPNKNKIQKIHKYNHKYVDITPLRTGGPPVCPAGGYYRARSASLGGLGVKPPEKSPRKGMRRHGVHARHEYTMDVCVCASRDAIAIEDHRMDGCVCERDARCETRRRACAFTPRRRRRTCLPCG